MKKIILVCLLIMTTCFALMGCNKEKNTGTEQENLESNQNKNVQVINPELYSSDTKVVFNYYNQYLIVFYFENNKIVGEELYYDFGDSETAASSVALMKDKYATEEAVNSVNQEGQYIIVRYSTKAYKNLTLSEVKKNYSYLEEVKE